MSTPTTTLEPTSVRLALSVTEAAKVLGISRASAYELVKTGELPSVKLGGRIIVPIRLLERMLNGEELPLG